MTTTDALGGLAGVSGLVPMCRLCCSKNDHIVVVVVSATTSDTIRTAFVAGRQLEQGATHQFVRQEAGVDRVGLAVMTPQDRETPFFTVNEETPRY